MGRARWQQAESNDGLASTAGMITVTVTDTEARQSAGQGVELTRQGLHPNAYKPIIKIAAIC